MALYITTDCINCGACEPECPNTAIYEPGAEWTLGDQTYRESYSPGGYVRDFWSAEYYYIVPDKCTECVGFYDEPQCAAVCPVDCCLPDPLAPETQEQLEAKKAYLDQIDPGRVRV
ncbi:MAG: 4Fe-4S dicluster domain-containing protein [Candidatus Kapabacteria bacterium]|nr:4Fe-4S dicluster domain-containing protein [Candidatus Kapabacteria bacterium]MCS7169300.1 4Fe-4S dicluster domain-containing protein [Candidatus Kapabacteria bacterium]MDW7996173.1 4Fe-4S dicluster domain-containing protein [Bacteroidota bacterium]MDW8224406.1 4Fe-4S dicluster domain-containing protein [Bacteroidota bacterium]